MNQYKLNKLFAKIPKIETERLLLRKLLPSDAADMYEYSRDPQVTEFLLWEPHPDKNYTARYLRLVQSQYRNGEFSDWALVRKSDGKMIGTCGFTQIDLRNNKGEVGYVLSPLVWGQGIAPEAVMAVMEFGFCVLGLERIEAKYIYGNDRSRRVMEKCGMTFEGIERSGMLIKDRYRDIGICSVLSSEFRTMASEHGVSYGILKKE